MLDDSDSQPAPPAAPGDAGPTMDPAAAGPTVVPPPTVAERLASFTEVVICSGFPTQIALALGLAALGWSPLTASGSLSLRYVATISLVDTLLIVGLSWGFLSSRGERPADVFFRHDLPSREALAGLASVPAILLGVGTLGMLLRTAFPELHNVPDNPLAALLGSPRDIAIFSVVVVLAGGVREEVQRAFVLHRFRQHLGGQWLGLVVFSLAFGVGHTVQGYDAALLTAVLGFIWGWMFLRRGSIVAPICSHAIFNLFEVAREVATR